MKSDSAPDTRPESAQVRWMNRTFVAVTILLASGMLLLVLGIALNTVVPSVAEVGVTLSMYILCLPIFGVLAVTFVMALWDTLHWLWQVPVLVFRKSQLRITDLVLIVALLGNGAGIIFSLFGDDSVTVAVLLMLFWFVWVFLATAWALWAATRQGERGSLRRAFFLLIGWAAPLAFIAILGGPCAMIIGVSGEFDRLVPEFARGFRVTWVVASALATALGFWVVNKAIHVHQDTTRGEAE